MQAVKVCHENGIANRDIKCENIMLDDEANLKIIDFGLSIKTYIDDMQSQKVGT